MTPKDKAVELIETYKAINIKYVNNGESNEGDINDEAKECALIAVDEITIEVKAIRSKLSGLGMWSYCDKSSFDEIINYYEQVKEEIKNL